jgi:hypothetical protein
MSTTSGGDREKKDEKYLKFKKSNFFDRIFSSFPIKNCLWGGIIQSVYWYYTESKGNRSWQQTPQQNQIRIFAVWQDWYWISTYWRISITLKENAFKEMGYSNWIEASISCLGKEINWIIKDDKEKS